MSGFFSSKRSIALLVSVALNLLFAAGIGAHFIQDATKGDRGTRFIERIADRLPPEDGAKLRALYEERRDALATARQEVRKRQEAYRAALRREPFDRQELVQATDRLTAERGEMYRVFVRMLVDAAETMSPEGRAALAERRR